MSTESYAYHDYSKPDPPHQPLYLKTILRNLKADPSIRRVLDAGCGDGNFTASLADAGYSMYGLDTSEGGIARARAARPDVRFAQRSVYEDLAGAFDDVDRFDAIVSIEVIEHLYDPRRFVKRAYDALRPGGLLILTTPYWGYLKNVVLALTNRIDNALTPLWDGGHIKHWSRKTITQLLLEQPFDFVSFVGAGRPIPYLWNGMVLTVRKKQPA